MYQVGIIGLGVGEKHAEAYQAHSSCVVRTLCDFRKEQLWAVGRKYPNCRLTGNANEILDDDAINIVSIASYDNYHYEQVIKAIENDKHIFVEKPLCLYENEAIHIRKLLDEKPHLKLSSNLILRKCPRFRLLKQKIRNGDMGKLFHIEGDYNYGRLRKITEGWRGKIDFYSVVYGGGVHIVDLLLWLTEEKISEVAAYGNNISSRDSQYKYNDSVTSILKFRSGITAKVSVHYGCVRPHFHSLNIYGTKTTFVNTQEYGLFYDSMDPDVEVKRIVDDYPGVHKGELIYSFVDSIIEDNKAGVTTDDVFNTMSVCFAIEKASYGSGSVKVKYL